MTTITANKKYQRKSSLVGIIQLILVIIAGSTCGFIVAAIHAVHYHLWDAVAEHSSATGRTLTNEANDCPLPDHATKITIRTNDKSFDLAVWNDGDFLTESILKSGFWEILEISGLAELGDSELPGENHVFWDIGANVGYYSFLFAAAGYDVVAVEPEHRNAELLRTSLCLNPEIAPRIELIDAAISSEKRESCKMIATAKAKRMKQYLHLIPRLSCEADLKCRGHNICQDTTVTTLDDILSKQRKKAPSVLKLDVEGHEYSVFQGARQLLQTEAVKLIQYENKDPRVEEKIAMLLEGYDYRIGTERGHDSNTVAVHKSHTTDTMR